MKKSKVGLKQKVQDPWHVGLLALSQAFSSASGTKYFMIDVETVYQDYNVSGLFRKSRR